MKLSVSAYRAHASAHKKILSSSYQSQLNYGSTAAASSSTPSNFLATEPNENLKILLHNPDIDHSENVSSSSDPSTSQQHQQKYSNEQDCSNIVSPVSQSNQMKSESNMGDDDPDQFDWSKSNQRWMKLRTTVQISSAIQKKPPLKREDSFLKRFSTRQIPETQETVEDTGSESATDQDKSFKRRRRYLQKRRSVVNPDENFYFYWLMVITSCVLYNLWTLIVRQSFPELQNAIPKIWIICDSITDFVFIIDLIVQLRTGYLEQGLMVYDDKKLATHYMRSKDFFFDTAALLPLDLLQFKFGFQPLIRFPRFLKVYRSIRFYYIVESRTVWPNLWRVVNLIHILLILAHWFGCFYYLLSEAEGFQGDWVYPYRPGDYATLTRKYLGSLYWSTLTLTTIGDLPTPETNAEPSNSVDGPRSLPRRGIKSRLLQFDSSYGYVFTIVSYLIGVFIFATIVGQVGNVITNRNANRLEFERLLDGAKTYMRHHKVPGGMKRRVLRWYDYSWSRGRIQGGGDINTALGLLPDKLKTELALHVNLSVLKKVTIFQECQPEFLHDLVLKMKAYIFTPGDSICRKGEVAREMFIIADGILEVLSETGKVLTTMKAGDFFGEIGILNLDGLNKRTADVRSVGYSELFSLSREDVLAAMKDYPEAQEILQTLGRKRLMEVRFVNKKHAQMLSEKAAEMQQDNSSDNTNANSASKKFVGKLKSDVKNIKGVLKKTRTNKRSETLEMKPLYGPAVTSSKNLLKRMSRVKSDDNQDIDDKSNDKEKTPSPIGAGLPLLQRLRLLKEKQDREEYQATKTTAMLVSPTSLSGRTISPQQSILEEPDAEQKTPQDDVKSPSYMTSPPMNLPGTTRNTNSSSPFKTNSKQFNLDPSQKPSLKVSFKEKIMEMQKTAHKKNTQISGSSSSNGNNSSSSVPTTINNDRENKRTVIPTISNNINELSSNFKSTKNYFEDVGSLKPWSKLKLATLLSTGSYTSLTNCSSDIITPIKTKSIISNNELVKKDIQNTKQLRTHNLKLLQFGQQSQKKYHSIFDLSPEYNELPFVKKLKILNERQKLVELESLIQTRSFSLDYEKTKNYDDTISNSLYRSQSEASGIQNTNFCQTNKIHDLNSTQQQQQEPQIIYMDDKCLLNSPLSPESNETQERQKLKSILKKLNQNKRSDDVEQEQLSGLLRAPTLEGPPNGNENPFGSIEDHGKFFCASTKNESFNNATTLQPSPTINLTHFEFGHDQFFKDTSSSGMIPSHSDNFNDEINSIVDKHMREVHKKFQSQLSCMASEVQKRDAIINKLQHKLKKSKSVTETSFTDPFSKSEKRIFDNSSSDSSEDQLFMRDDSINSIRDSFTSGFQQCYSEISHSSSNNVQSEPLRPKNIFHSNDDYRRLSDDYPNNQLPLNIDPNSQIQSGVIVDIDDSDDTGSSSSSQSNLDEADSTSNKSTHRKQSNDWEVRMLAAELDRREKKRGLSLSDNISSRLDAIAGPSLRHRRRKFSDTETECSETDAEIFSRPRAVSLDQFNLGLRAGRIKQAKEKERL